MANFTVAIPDELLAKSKVVAALAETSVNALIRALLEGHIESSSSALSGNYQILFRYSIGKITEEKALALLQQPDRERLHNLVRHAGLPLPRLDLQEAKKMQETFSEMIDRFGTKGKAL